MRILITGGLGFVGSHLMAAIAGGEHELFSLCRARSEARQAAIRGTQILCDLRDAGLVRQVVKDVQPEAVIHLASVSSVGYSYDHPNEVLDVNVMGTVNLAEACHSEVAGLRQFLFASTADTYGLGPLPKHEETPQNPGSPYAVSKLAGEKYLLYLRDACGFPITILRPFNTYGRKETTSFVVERIIWQMLHQDAVRLGNPSIIRDWLHIDDHVEAYRLCLGNKNAVGEIFNLCTGRALSVADLAAMVSRLTGFQGRVEWNTFPKRALDIPTLVGNAGKAAESLGWRASIGLEDGLRMAVEYWRNEGKAPVFGAPAVGT